MRYRITTASLVVMVITVFLQIPLVSEASSIETLDLTVFPGAEGFGTDTVGAQGQIYYVATNGDDSNPGTEAQPFRTINRGVSVLSPGDTLYIQDGIYNESVHISKQGAVSSPITIRAEHDGGAIVDGEMQRVPLYIQSGARHVIVAGIRFQNSSGHTILVNGRNITMRRVSGYTSGDGNVHVFTVAGAQDILLEDCAASGKGRNLYLVYESERVTLRRCWGWWMARNDTGLANYIGQIYGSDDVLIENCVGTIDPNASVDNASAWAFWIADWNSRPSNDNNAIIGSVYYGFDYHDAWHGHVSGKTQIGNTLKNTVLIGGGYTGVFQRAGHDFTLENVTIVDDNRAWAAFRADDFYGVNPTAEIKNSVFVGGDVGIRVDAGANVAHSHNDFHNVRTPFMGTFQGEGETFVDPGYNVSKYGKGAYLIAPLSLEGMGESGSDVGAEVLYRSMDDVLTDEPLWPWPMEDRIQREMEELFGNRVSVTWEAMGGIWKTLDGVYPLSPTPTSTPPPPPSTKLPQIFLPFVGKSSLP